MKERVLLFGDIKLNSFATEGRHQDILVCSAIVFFSALIYTLVRDEK